MMSMFNVPSFTQMLYAVGASPGVATDKLDCGCILTAEHFPTEKHWIFRYNYAECRDKRLSLSARLVDYLMNRKRHQIETLKCGCILIMDCYPEKRLYEFKHDYSKCKGNPFFQVN
jgi:hypothetical protein